MSHTVVRTRSSSPRRRSTAIGLIVVVTVILCALAFQSSSVLGPSFARGLGDGLRGGGATSTDGADVTRADGLLPDHVTVFDTHYPGVTNLDPGLLEALRKAATAAQGHASPGSTNSGRGTNLYVNSGWRSARYQDQLLQEAIVTYGSEREAARWVATPTTSPHVSGEAVDLGPFAATAWLAEHGARFGLCQIYRNEPWHYELRPDARDDGCPVMYDDPTRDPRMQR